jgi:recombination protein RecA
MSLEAIMKKYKDIITSASTPRAHQFISMGPLSVNLLLGNPLGVQSGRIIQVTGKPSHGKTTLVLDICAQYLNAHQDRRAMFVDFERTFDPAYAAACGIPLDRLLIVRPNFAEEGMTVLEEAIEKDVVQLAIVDSVPAALPRDELDKDFGDRQKMASSASIITRFCQRAVGLLDNKDATVILVNQLRKNFSTLSREEEIPFGGMALQYASSVIINVYRIGAEDDRARIQATIKKSKVSNPLGKAEFTIRYGTGIDHALDILDLALERDIVRKSGSWYSYDEVKAQGADRASELFPMAAIRQQIIESESVVPTVELGG